MDSDNGYDMSTEEIQKEIMENLQTWSVPNSDDVNFEISQEDKIILKPYVRPSPAELFKLTEDDKVTSFFLSVRWFGPRLPDVTGLSPVKIARIKHQASKLLTHSKNCWLIRNVRNDLVMLLDKSLLSCLTGILKAVVDKCGYQVIWLSRFTCVTPPDICALRMLLVGESNLRVKANCNPMKSALEPSSPEMLIILRRENANKHAIHLCEHVKIAVQKCLDSSQKRRSTTTVISVKYRFALREVPELVPVVHKSKSTNQSPPRAPHPDCDSLGFVLITTCAHTKPPCKLASRTQHNRGLTLLGEFIEHVSQQQWPCIQLRLLALKWLSLAHIPSQHVELAYRALCPHDPTALLSWMATEQHHGHCGFGLFVVCGQRMEHCLNSWCHCNQQTMFSTDLIEVEKQLRIAFSSIQHKGIDERNQQAWSNNANTVAVFDDLLDTWSTGCMEANLIAMEHLWNKEDNAAYPTDLVQTECTDSSKCLHHILELFKKHRIIIVGLRFGWLDEPMVQHFRRAKLKNLNGDEVSDKLALMGEYLLPYCKLQSKL
ncbi:uncharacterized protein DEA37_0004323 [Paragonimus westermani]|uniref:Uncharacterized protein n=1 Tax=Paragonimus westermani TaxID=34504 RepID=A0A5J4P357_9TREM|nr:uncharacterized protein DEA37_0004323 [Paragonimus westermani]